MPEFCYFSGKKLVGLDIRVSFAPLLALLSVPFLPSRNLVPIHKRKQGVTIAKAIA